STRHARRSPARRLPRNSVSAAVPSIGLDSIASADTQARNIVFLNSEMSRLLNLRKKQRTNSETKPTKPNQTNLTNLTNQHEYPNQKPTKNKLYESHNVRRG